VSLQFFSASGCADVTYQARGCGLGAGSTWSRPLFRKGTPAASSPAAAALEVVIEELHHPDRQVDLVGALKLPWHRGSRTGRLQHVRARIGL
jgi:hypothetical protein